MIYPWEISGFEPSEQLLQILFLLQNQKDISESFCRIKGTCITMEGGPKNRLSGGAGVGAKFSISTSKIPGS
jgi:hypothetical protein